MKRRQFIGGLTGGAAWAFVARAQQPALPVIGILSGGSADLFAPLGTALDSGLNENGFVVGKTFSLNRTGQTVNSTVCPAWRPL
jgi:putative ABC transport system substrate-binding protein